MNNLPRQIKDMIPHKPPMLLVNELLQCTAEQALVVSYPREDHPFKAGELLEEIVGIELIAQAYAAYRARQAESLGQKLRIGYLVGVQRAVLSPLPAEQNLYIRVWTVGEFEDFAVAEGEIYADQNENKILAEAKLKLWSPVE